ncbi:MAG TPA: PP2C family protein-serine/threonine phosphatase, partial [Limnobacter sp.]|nr:PP2C family protein-serine/threonine phosphatase [Limnobacter sp.]
MTSSNIALVIGEERQSAEAIERLLAPFGLTCLHVFDPEVASTRLDLQSVRLLVFSGARRCREGLDWAERLRAQPHGQFVYVVMLCGPQWPIDTPALPPGLVDQCVFEPLVEHGLITAALAAVRLGRLHKEFSSLSSELPGYKATLERDLFLLRQLQLSMMPKDKQLVAGTEVRLFSQPKTMLSGDQAGVFELGPDCLGFYLVDVVGHGMPAAVRALGFSRLFSGLPHESAAYREPLNADEPLVLRSSAEVMTVLNQVYQISDDDQAYVCAIYGVFNRQSRELDLCVAGMPLPYVVDPHGRQSALGQHDLPLGVVEQHVYTGTRVVLQPNESLLMVSDGVLEVPGPANALLGAEGLVKMLADCIKSHYHNLPDCLAHSIEAWAGRSRNVLFNDDATMIELNFDPPAVQVAAPHPVAVLAREAGLANPLSPGVIEQANRTFSGSAASQLNLARPVQRALLIVDQPGPCESLAQTLSSQGISVQSIAHNYFLTDGDPLFDGIDLVCLFASKHSLKAGKWIQLLADTCADEPPFVLVLHEGSDLAQARELSKLGADFFLPTPVHTAALTACLAYADRKNGIVRAMGQKAIELECVR